MWKISLEQMQENEKNRMDAKNALREHYCHVCRTENDDIIVSDALREIAENGSIEDIHTAMILYGNYQRYDAIDSLKYVV